MIRLMIRLTVRARATVAALSLAAVLFAARALAQAAAPGVTNVVSLTSPDGRTTRHEIPPGAVLVQALAQNGAATPRLVVPGAPQRFIVQFRAPPIERARRLGLDFEACRAPYRRFLRAVPALAARMAALRPGAGRAVQVGMRFETVFNGVALSGPPELAASLRALPDVAGVFLDDTVRAAVEPSMTPAATGGSWSADAAGGEGVDVAIIDTGIDYTHPDLGGCFGPGCRVTAGWDFVNQDSDPMDDHGHGTHVAGIVGARGRMLGVAPGVRFHAYKVLSADGYGMDSWIIAGIERAVDPDQNPATRDAVDIINLSLGGVGDADSPISQAVDEAVAAGVVCVVAAGNDGKYFTVGSPGAARRAITVGASDRGTTLALFSSRGPAAPDWTLKPDVVAPGVNISSTWPGRQYMTLSGTSMATPYVAGSAALMRQSHPDWTPDQIKAALMNTAEPAGSPYEGGAGLVHEADASSLGLVAEPGSLSFQRVPPGAVPGESRRWLLLSDHSSIAHTVHLSAEGSYPAGVSVAIDPADVVVGAGSDALVAVTVTADPGLATPEAEPFAYWGRIVVRDGASRRNVPFGFTKAAEIAIDFDRPDGLVLLHDRNGHQAVSGWHSARLVHPGTFDVIALVAGERWIVREGIVVADREHVAIGQNEAIYTMRSVPVDETGRTVDSPFGVELLYHRATGIAVIVILERRDDLLVSPMSDAYAWEWVHYQVWPPEKTYTWLAGRRGIAGDQTFQNAPGDLRHVASEYRVPPGAERILPLHYVCNGPAGLPVNGFILGISNYSTLDPPQVVPFTLHSYFMQPDHEFQFGAWYNELDGYDEGGIVEITPYVRAEPGRPAAGYVMGEAHQPVCTLPGDRMRGGFGPPVWFGRFENLPDSLRFRASLGRTSWVFPLQGGGWMWPGNLPYALARDGVPVESGTLSGMGDVFGDSLVRRGITPGPHTWTITDSRYWIDGHPGVARAVATFDSRRADPDPPYLTELSILANGALTDTCGARTSNEVRIGVRDDQRLATVRLYQRVRAQDPWVEMSVKDDGTSVRARLPDSTGFLSLRIDAMDAAGNRLEYTLEPAVHIESAIPVAPLTGVADIEGGTLRVTWHVPDALYDLYLWVDRSLDGETWSRIGAPVYESGAFSVEDAEVLPEHRYGYRLAIVKDGLERLTPVTWVIVPAYVLAFAGALQNPSVGGPVARFVLPDARPARLEAMDLAGRRIVSVDVGALGPGPHRVSLAAGGAWKPGIYFLRLQRPDGVITRKVCVLR